MSRINPAFNPQDSVVIRDLGSHKSFHTYERYFIERKISLNEHSKAEMLLNAQKKAGRNPWGIPFSHLFTTILFPVSFSVSETRPSKVTH